jgi:hypothetical protein
MLNLSSVPQVVSVNDFNVPFFTLGRDFIILEILYSILTIVRQHFTSNVEGFGLICDFL